MANFVSPGVYVIEKDLSNYPTSINPSVVGIVGFAGQGPTNKAKLITSQEGLMRMFGNPEESLTGQGLEGAVEILESTNTAYYVRAVGSDATAASSTVQIGACPSFVVSSKEVTDDTIIGAGTTGGTDLYLDVQVVADGKNVFASPKQFNIPAGTVPAGDGNKQAYAINKIIGGAIEGAAVGSYFASTDLSNTWVTAGYSGSGITLYASAFSGSGRTAAVNVKCLVSVDASGNTDALPTSSITAYGLSFNTADLGYEVASQYKGGGYNEGTKSDGTTSGYSAQILETGGRTSPLQINRDGFAAESFNVSLVASADFVEDAINTGITNVKSEYIQGNLVSGSTDLDFTPLPYFYSKLSDAIEVTDALDAVDSNSAAHVGATSRFNKFVKGTYSLADGSNGAMTATELIGDSTDKTGVHALNDDTLNVSLGIVPGVTTQSVQNELITVAESTQNFMAIVSPPQGLTTVQQAIDWSNGQSDERTAAITSNYAAIYWPWVQTYDNFAKKDRWFDPAIYAVRQMCYTDEVSDPWFAPAGVVRGTLTKPTDVEVSVNEGDRDSMYSGGNVINPIVNFPQQGIIIFGQRTAQRDSTALDRVNVRRLLIQVKKVLLSSTRRFVFEPNDATTWEKITGVVEPLMDDIRRRQGLVDYKVICDDTTNTAIRVDRNEMWCKVLIKPTKAAEIIVFELNLTSQAAQI